MVPESFAAMPRWWSDGNTWLDELPARVCERCAHWGLRVAGPATHGSNALVVPVVRGHDELALRLTPPTDDVAGQVFALEFWAGRGAVRLIDADPECGAMLLERLDARRSLLDEPVDEAMAVLGGMMRRLAVPAPDNVCQDRSPRSLGAGGEARQRAGRGVEQAPVRPCPERSWVSSDCLTGRRSRRDRTMKAPPVSGRGLHE